tara:strand:+ start:220 stop:774 length:555 start_codon:yes stop_codon:yes gene_type:complete
MQKGLTNITSATTTTLVDEDLRSSSFDSISMANTHASTAVTVELYIQDRINTVEVLSTLVNLAQPGITSTTGVFDALTNVEVGDEVIFLDAEEKVLPQKESIITVVSLTSATECEFSSIVIAPDDSVATFSQLEKAYIIKTDVPAQTTLVLEDTPTINNKKSTLKLKTTSSGLAIFNPLSVIIT